MSSWDEDFTSSLIILVQQNKILFDKRNPNYFNRLMKERTWQQIGEQINKTGSECKAKWTHLRERYGRELKKERRPSGSGGAEDVEWTFFSEMDFLRDSMQPRKTRCNELDETITPLSSSSDWDSSPDVFAGVSGRCNSGTSNSSTSSALASTPAKKVKSSFDGLCERFGSAIGALEDRFRSPIAFQNDESDELFLRTALSMMKDLPFYEKDQLKIELLTKISEARRQFAMQ